MSNLTRQQIREKIEGMIVEKVQQTVEDIAVPLAQQMPFQTGFAASGTNVSVGSPLPGPTRRPSLAVAAEQAVTRFKQNASRLEAILAGYELDKGVVYLANSVEYVVDLNRGSSQQAPRGFIDNIVLEAFTKDPSA